MSFAPHASTSAAASSPLMAWQVVEDDHIACPKFGDEHLADVFSEGSAIHRTVKHEGCDQPFGCEACEECCGLPVPARGAAKGARSNVRPGMAARHIRSGACFIEEDQAALKIRLHPSPFGARLGHVRPFLFAGVHAFF